MITVQKVSAGKELIEAFAIRRKVFVEEHKCPPELEYSNEETSTHFLATMNGTPCGAARWRQTPDGYKLERFAVLAEYRGRGVGSELLKAVLEDIPDDAKKVYLHAQLTAVQFYRPFAFIPEGELFEEAGIMHQKMVLSGAG